MRTHVQKHITRGIRLNLFDDKEDIVSTTYTVA
jgi:hypothetical protein